jgi:hypothetical protein
VSDNLYERVSGLDWHNGVNPPADPEDIPDPEVADLLTDAANLLCQKLPRVTEITVETLVPVGNTFVRVRLNLERA